MKKSQQKLSTTNNNTKEAHINVYSNHSIDLIRPQTFQNLL